MKFSTLWRGDAPEVAEDDFRPSEPVTGDCADLSLPRVTTRLRRFRMGRNLCQICGTELQRRDRDGRCADCARNGRDIRDYLVKS